MLWLTAPTKLIEIVEILKQKNALPPPQPPKTPKTPKSAVVIEDEQCESEEEVE